MAHTICTAIFLVAASLVGGYLAVIPVKGKRDLYRKIERLEKVKAIKDKRTPFYLIQGGKDS
jgi:hypothetical protein